MTPHRLAVPLVIGMLAGTLASCSNAGDGAKAAQSSRPAAASASSSNEASAASSSEASSAQPAAPASSGPVASDLSLTVNSLWVAGSGESDALKAVIGSFETATGVDVKLRETGDTLADTWETDVAGGKEADVVFINFAEKVTNWAKVGAVAPADDFLASWDLVGKIRPEAVEQWRDTEGKLVGFPYTGFVWPTWYNTKLLTKAGIASVPKTVEELIDAAGKLRAAGIQPVSIGGGDWNGQKLFQQVAQTFTPAAQTKEVFAKGGYCKSPSIMKGIELFVRLRDAGVFIDDAQGYTAEAQSTAFFTGKAAMMPAGSWAFPELPADIAESTQIGGFPVSAGSEFAKPAAYSGYTSVGVLVGPSGAKKNADAVKQFVQFLYAPDSVAQFVGKNVMVAATTADQSKISNSLLRQAVGDLDQQVQFAVMPDGFVPGAVADPLIRATAQAFAPKRSAAAICKAIDAAYASAG